MGKLWRAALIVITALLLSVFVFSLLQVMAI
jgi:hypothetical protein